MKIENNTESVDNACLQFFLEDPEVIAVAVRDSVGACLAGCLNLEAVMIHKDTADHIAYKVEDLSTLDTDIIRSVPPGVDIRLIDVNKEEVNNFGHVFIAAMRDGLFKNK